ncbi:siderophore-interacting protein [Sphingobacterium sp. lm-10]|uniref:siderophore-interacting protein n=1 Tax=Sphingobacterium sp. lm-10 TaxID=2944904 RepID=UPI00202138F7|nr:siderophore-interacting protein [Sphingobacterium sp. lm-10]MCL7988197.1 siderophore-interacting protein [Sphingobacterium sp. lm-10]
MERPVIAKHVFRVWAKEYVTPHYIRVTLEGEGAQAFAPCSLGANNKIMIPPSGQKAVKLAVWDDANSEWILPAEHERPIIRTYTHRAIDTENNRIILEFVDHGDAGPASSWARRAEKGDELGVAMKIKETQLYPTADWYLLVGDATAIPVLHVILESLPPEAKGHCIVEVHSADDVQADFSHPGFSIDWVFNAHPEKGSTLYQKVLEADIPEGKESFGYVACEYQSVKQIRAHFKHTLGWDNKSFYAFSYWKAGTAEDKSAQDRREENT